MSLKKAGPKQNASEQSWASGKLQLRWWDLRLEETDLDFQVEAREAGKSPQRKLQGIRLAEIAMAQTQHRNPPHLTGSCTQQGLMCLWEPVAKAQIR